MDRGRGKGICDGSTKALVIKSVMIGGQGQKLSKSLLRYQGMSSLYLVLLKSAKCFFLIEGNLKLSNK